MFKFLVLWSLLGLLCLSPRLGFAQETNEASMSGSVYDQASKKKIPRAAVVLLQNKRIRYAVNADAHGDFKLQGIKPGNYDILCEATGYVPQKLLGAFFEGGQERMALFRLKVYEGDATQKPSPEIVATYRNMKEQARVKVSTATLNEEAFIDIPATGFVISQDDIRQRGYHSLLDILKDLPEVEVQQNVTANYLNIISSRGMTGGGRWLILMDGARIGSLVGSENVIDQNFSIRFAERIEIIIGPASALYGADAFAGVINIVMPTAEEGTKVQASLSYGQYQTTNNSFQVLWGKGDWRVLAQGSYYRSGEPNLSKFYPQDYAWFLNQYSQQGRMLNSIYDTSTQAQPILPYDMSRNAFSNMIKIQYKNWQLAWYHNQEQHNSSLGHLTSISAPTAAQCFSNAIYSAVLSHKTEKLPHRRWQLNSTFNFSRTQVNPHTRFLNAFSGYDTAYKYAYDRGLRLREALSYSLSKNQTLILGFTAQVSNSLGRTSDMPMPWQRGQSIEEQGQYYLGTDVLDADGVSMRIPQLAYQENRFMGGIFAQYQLRLANRWDFTAGLRGDYNLNGLWVEREIITRRSYQTLNPRFGVVYKPTENWRFKIFYGEAFLNPSPQVALEHFGSFSPVQNDQGENIGFQGSFFRLPNPNLQPEKLRTAELNLGYFGQHWVINSNAFFSLANNLVGRKLYFNERFLGQDIAVAQYVVNTRNAQSYGGTLQIGYRNQFWGEKASLQAWAAYTFINGYTEPDQAGQNETVKVKLPYTAMHSVKGQAFFRYEQWSINLGTQYRSRSYLPATLNNLGEYDQRWAPSFWLFNSQVNYTFNLKNNTALDLFVQAQNLFDRRYYHLTEDNQAYFGLMPQDPLRVLGGINLRF